MLYFKFYFFFIIDNNLFYQAVKKQMELPPCPILYPTMQEFSNFYKYVLLLDSIYKKDYGMVKIVPPAEWKTHTGSYEHKLDNLIIKHPIQQNVQGLGGYYQSKNIIQQKLSFKAYKRYAVKQSAKFENKSIAQKETLFWKTITYSPPIYGADVTSSLMDETAGAWNFNSLESIQRYAFTQRVKGVTEPYCYIGTWKAFFSWHKEDLDLSAINIIHEGDSKVWYAIASEHSYILQNEARRHFKSNYQKCKQFLRHKTFLINPSVLLQKNKELKISRMEHNAGEIMIVFGGSYHQGFNCGFNIAEAVNFATKDWLRQLPEINYCSCFKRSVRAQKQSILYNLQESHKFQELLTIPQFQVLRTAVQQDQFKQQNMEGLKKMEGQVHQNGSEKIKPVQGQQLLIENVKIDDLIKNPINKQLESEKNKENTGKQLKQKMQKGNQKNKSIKKFKHEKAYRKAPQMINILHNFKNNEQKLFQQNQVKSLKTAELLPLSKPYCSQQLNKEQILKGQ